MPLGVTSRIGSFDSDQRGERHKHAAETNHHRISHHRSASFSESSFSEVCVLPSRARSPEQASGGNRSLGQGRNANGRESQ